MNNPPAPTLPAAERARSPLWQVIGTAHQLEMWLESRLDEVGLSVAKVSVLKVLVEAGDALPLGELAECQGCVRSNMTQLVDRLEADGLVRRVADANDRRIRRASLTPAGREAFEKGRRVMEELEQEVAKALRGSEAAALERTLNRMTS